MDETVTISLMFTDIVDSTALASRVGPEAAEELRRAHFDLLRELIAEHRGAEVKSLGDGVMVAFSSMGDACACAVRMQQRVDLENSRSSEPLLIRIGLSVGDCELDRGDYYGPTPVEAARLCAAAEGGEILAVELLGELLGGRGGHVFEPVGRMELKGLTAPLRTARIKWEPLSAGATSLPLPERLDAEPAFGFFGRVEAFERLEEAFKAALTSSRQVALVSGEAGIGKTRLATETARSAHTLGATILYGHSDEELGVAYQPFSEALRHLVEHSRVGLLEAHVARFGGELSRLVPELAARVPTMPAPQETEPATEQRLLFAAVIGLLAAASAAGGMVLVLDDLHWSDKPTLLLLKYLVCSRAPMRLLVVGTYRDHDLTRTHPLTSVLAALHRESGVERVALGGLGDVELLALMENAAGHELDEAGVSLAHALRQETDGNPFFAVEILRHLAESGGIYEEDGRWRIAGGLDDVGLPPSIHEVIGWRVARMGDAALSILTTAATIGREFDLDVLTAAVDDDVVRTLDDDGILGVLEQAERASLVTEERDRPRRFLFAHALIGHTLYADLSATRQARAHRRVAEALERLHGSDESRVPELAEHWLAARVPDGERALHYLCRAGNQALAQLAPDAAARWYSQALDLLDGAGRSATAPACDLLIRRGEAERRAGDGAFRQTLLDAASLAERLGDTELLVGAALANNRGQYSSSGQTDVERIAVLEAALERLDHADSTVRAVLLAQLSVETLFTGDWERRIALSDEALAMARRLGDPVALTQVFRLRYEAIRLPHLLEQRLADTAEYSALADQLADPVHRVAAALWRSDACWENGDVDEARQCLADARVMLEKFDDAYLEWSLAQRSAFSLMLDGRLEDGEAGAFAAFEIAAAAEQPDGAAVLAAQLLEIRWHQGRLAEIEPLVAQTTAENPGIPGFRAVLALTYCELDRDEDAAGLFDRDASRGFADFLYDTVWIAATAYLAEVCSQLGRRDAAATLYEKLLPWEDQLVYSGASVIGAVARYLGLLATTLEKFEDAERHFAAALETHERVGAPIYAARTRVDWARALLAQPGARDRARARDLLEDARTAAQTLGLANVERRAVALLEGSARG